MREERGARQAQGGPPRLKWRAFLALVVVCAALAGAAIAGFALLLRSSQSEPKALIVDQLDQTFPNPTFVKEAGTLLTDAGYDVYYTPGEKVTVDFYRQLGRYGYDVIVLRTHVGRLEDPATEEFSNDAALFTAEPYSETTHLEDQAARLLGMAYYYPGGELYFGVLPQFITSAAKGRFDGATVIVMGCDALRSDAIASAFVEKGAKTVVGWDGPVSAEHTDAATERLLRYLVADKRTPSEAVAETMAEVGPDPSYGSKLVLYPSEAAASAGN